MQNRQQRTFNRILNRYHRYDICMGELLADQKVPRGLSFEDAFELYVAAMKYVEEDRFIQIMEGDVLEYVPASSAPLPLRREVSSDILVAGSAEATGMKLFRKVIKDFFFIPEEDRKGITDSLLLDSGQKVLSGCIGDIRVCVYVSGDVRVLWDGEPYKAASQFPDELTEAIRRRALAGCMSDNPRMEIAGNNWYEASVWNGDTLVFEDLVEIDIHDMTDDDARDFITGCVIDELKNERYGT